MLLVEMTINGVMHRLSMGGLALEHWWANQIIAFDTPKYSLSVNYGGFARLNFGGITLSPELFSDDWPPPLSCNLVAKYSNKDETTAEVIFNGIAHLSGLNREAVRYDLYGPRYVSIISEGTSLSGTLASVISWACESSRLNLMLDITAARETSPAVIYTVPSDCLLIDLISELCAFFSHCFHISDGCLYLIDMLRDNGGSALSEYDFFPVDYIPGTPVAAAESGGFIKTSTYQYGDSIAVPGPYHNIQGNIETALADILSIVNAPRGRCRIPFTSGLPTIGQKVSWTDTAMARDTAAYIRARELSFDFVGEVVEIEGEGGIAAA